MANENKVSLSRQLREILEAKQSGLNQEVLDFFPKDFAELHFDAYKTAIKRWLYEKYGVWLDITYEWDNFKNGTEDCLHPISWKFTASNTRSKKSIYWSRTKSGFRSPEEAEYEAIVLAIDHWAK